VRDAFTVFIVDDDAPIRDALGQLLGLQGYRTAPFATAEAFLASLRPDWRGCVITDLRMPGMDGIALQQELRRLGCSLPVIVITGHGDIASARAAFLADAVDFLEKPFNDEAAIRAIESAFERESRRVSSADSSRRKDQFWSELTVREREIARLVLQGMHNREIASGLGISARTVEVHKARIMDKAGARGLADLIRIAGSDPA
jgi:RNA polymerase sigma factor (sigma-70 family)